MRLSLPWRHKQDLDNMNCLPKAPSLSTPHSVPESLRTSSVLKKPPKETGHSKLVGFSEQLQEEPSPWKSRGTSEIRKLFLKCCSVNQKPIHTPQQYLEMWSIASQSMTTSKESSFYLLFILVKCWNVYRQCLKQFSWPVLQVNCKNSYTDFYKNEFKRKALVDLPLIFPLHSLH